MHNLSHTQKRPDSVVKQFVHGTHRVCTPNETLAAIEPHFSTFGITRIADVTGLDSIGMPVYMAVRPNSKSLAVAQGKGISVEAAKVSAAMESIEQHFAENDTLETIESNYATLSKDEYVCDPARLPQHPYSVYHDNYPLQWTRGFDLIGQREIFVPYDAVHLNYLVGADNLPTLLRSTTGLASGNTLIEAISHAACEVIERDATALWELTRAEPEVDETAIALESIDSPICRSLIERIQSCGLAVFIWNQTSDIGIPAFAAIIAEERNEALRRRKGNFGGYGCHPSKEIALLRALTEAAQSRLTQISGARDDMYRSNYQLQQESALALSYSHMMRMRGKPSVDFAALTSTATDTLDGDVRVVIDRLQHAGFEQVIAVDLSLPQYDFAVVRVIIPDAEYKGEGMRHRFGKRAKEQTLRALVKRYFF